MKGEGAPSAKLLSRTALALASAALLASCSSTSDPLTRLGLAPQVAATSVGAASTDKTVASAEAQTGYFIISEEDPILPDQVAELPLQRTGERLAPLAANAAPAAQPAIVAAVQPTQAEIDAIVQTRIGPGGAAIEAAPPAVPAAAPATAPQPKAKKRGFLAALFGTEESAAPAQPVAQPQPENSIAAAAESASPAVSEQIAPVAAAAETVAPAATTEAETGTQVAATTFIENRPPEAAQDIAGPKKRGFLSAFFSRAEAAPAPTIIASPTRKATEPVLTFASAAPATHPIDPRALMGNDPLPGVRHENLFEIKRKSGVDDDSDIDLHEGGEEIEVASAAGLARLAPNGLLMQTDRVDVACLKPSLVRVLKTIESHYGRKMLVTSGYRSPPVNRRARGARNSLHMYCAAADVQVPGVTKWELAEFVRSMPGRGGVGTYCHTNSVHIDVGPERDWNWRCRKRRK